MIRITIELVPKDVTLGVIEILNTGKNPWHPSHGDYKIKFIDKSGRCFKSREIKNWPRSAKSIWLLIKEVFKIY